MLSFKVDDDLEFNSCLRSYEVCASHMKGQCCLTYPFPFSEVSDGLLNLGPIAAGAKANDYRVVVLLNAVADRLVN